MINIILFIAVLAVVFYLANTYNIAKIAMRVIFGIIVAIMVLATIWLLVNQDNL